MSIYSSSLGWPSPPAVVKLGVDEVHLWRASLNCNGSVLSRLESTLSPDELARANRFVYATDRDHFVAARGILRELLASYLTLVSSKLRFCYGNYGKPALDLGMSSLPLQFNLSHSGGLAVYAFSLGRRLGVDVEQIRPERAGDDVAGRYFAPREVAELSALTPQLRLEGFFLCWTRKEAYVKAHGAGLSLPLASFTVSLSPGRPEELQSPDSDSWSLRCFEPAPGYAAALVGEGKEWRLLSWSWNP